MEWFPFYMNIEDADCLIVGGGTVALRKVEKLLPFRPRITVAAPEICEPIRSLDGIRTVYGRYAPELLDGRSFVIAASGDREVNARVAADCRARSIPVNAVDSREDCTFIFPSMVKRGPLTAAFSTGGASPTAAILLKEQLEQQLPPNTEQLLTWLDSVRPLVRGCVPEEKARAALFRELTERCFRTGKVPEEEELSALLEQYK